MGHTSELNHFLDGHKNQLLAANVPEYFWPTLYRKLTNVTFDVGHSFQILECNEFDDHEPPRVLQSIKNMNMSDSENIYLIDHAWTFRLDRVKYQLKENNILLDRLCNMLGFKSDTANRMEKVLNDMWKIVNWYSLDSAEEIEDRLPYWYIMDEVGSAVWHSDIPNCRIVPFVYAKDQIAYSVMFLTQDIEEGEFIFRDFAEGIAPVIRRAAYLIPWQPISMEHISIVPSLPNVNYFLSGHIRESLPNLIKLSNKIKTPDILKVYSQYDLVKKYLTSNRFEIVETEDEADILWYTEHFKDFEELSNTPLKFVNQFPYEYVITVKDLFCIICRRHSEAEKWIPTSYNLLTELHNFISYFQSREIQGLDNIWIVKPYNLARGLDIHITNNLKYLIRLSVTGPKIVQKYITNPVLFYRPECNGKVKFDVRYVLLLKSIKPLEAYIYKHFFLRFANKPFELNEFDSYEKHFTVMNYNENLNLKHIRCDEFLVEFALQYPNHNWTIVEKSIVKMLRDILDSATSTEPPCGIAKSPQSRALYAADIMLEWNKKNEMEPKVLEINFMPDCKRACDYYPDFYDEIFQLLFLGECLENFLLL